MLTKLPACGVMKGSDIKNRVDSLIDSETLYTGIKELPQIDGVTLNVKGFYVGSDVGGGQFYYDPDRDKADHNGGTVIAPEAIAAWDGSTGDIATLLDWAGVGSGCFVRILDGDSLIEFFGAVGDGLNDDTPSAIAALANGGLLLSSGRAYLIGDVGEVADLNIYSGHGGVRPSVTGLIVRATGSISVKGVRFNILTECINMFGSVTSLLVEGCKFIGGYRAIYAQPSVSLDYENIKILNNSFMDMTGNSGNQTIAVSIRHATSIKSATISNNTFKGIKSSLPQTTYVCWIGADPAEDDNSEIVFTGNVVTDCGILDSNATMTSFGLRGQGANVSFSGNVVTDCLWLNGIYSKGSNISITGNSIHRTLSGGIAVKGGFNTAITGNVVTGACNYRPAIRLNGSGICANNVVEVDIDASFDSDASGGIAFETTPINTGQLSVLNNTLKGVKSLKISHGGRILVSGNNMEGTDSLQYVADIKGAGDADSPLVVFESNTVIGGSGCVNVFGDVIDVSIGNNTITSADAVADPLNIVFSGNLDLRGNKVRANANSGAAGTGCLANISHSSPQALPKVSVADNHFYSAALMDTFVSFTLGNSVDLSIKGNEADSGVDVMVDRATYRVEMLNGGVGEPRSVTHNGNEFFKGALFGLYLDYIHPTGGTNVICSNNIHHKDGTMLRTRSGTSISTLVTDGTVFVSGVGTVLSGAPVAALTRSINNELPI